MINSKGGEGRGEEEKEEEEKEEKEEEEEKKENNYKDEEVEKRESCQGNEGLEVKTCRKFYELFTYLGFVGSFYTFTYVPTSLN
jgi:hypothetical protein